MNADSVTGTGGSYLRAIAALIRDSEASLIVGVILLGLGIMPFANGLYGYYVILPEIERSQQAVDEAAEEMELGEIPRISTDDYLATYFGAMIAAGGCMTVGAAILLVLAYARKRDMRET